MKKTFFTKSLLDKLKQKNQETVLEVMYKAQDKSREGGFDFQTIDQVMEKVEEEFSELKEAFEYRDSDREHFLEELGDCFFALVNLSRHAHEHPEQIVEKNTVKYLKRCEYIENYLEKNNKEWTDLSSEEIGKLWKEAKSREN